MYSPIARVNDQTIYCKKAVSVSTSKSIYKMSELPHSSLLYQLLIGHSAKLSRIITFYIFPYLILLTFGKATLKNRLIHPNKCHS